MGKSSPLSEIRRGPEITNLHHSVFVHQDIGGYARTEQHGKIRDILSDRRAQKPPGPKNKNTH
jgi:hypothetical protein